MKWLSKRERPLFRTHEPPFRCPAWAVGQILEHEGRLYRVTRWVELRAVLLERGGSVGHWEIWGRKISNREVRAELRVATDRILSDG